jgi:hypothetical protein
MSAYSEFARLPWTIEIATTERVPPSLVSLPTEDHDIRRIEVASEIG